MILIYGSKTDISARKVSGELNRRNIDYAWVDTKDIFDTKKSTLLNHSLDTDGITSKFWFKSGGQKLDLTEVTVIYVRNPSNVVIEDRTIDGPLNGWVDRELKNYVWETLELLKCQWFPAKPSSIYTMENEKLKELYVALEIGLTIPDTIVTNEPRSAIKFFQKHNGRIISKRYSRPRIPFENTEFAAPTQPVSLRDIGYVKHVQYAPTLFQEYVPKLKELRVTVDGDVCVAAEIDSQQTHRTKHDWRTYDKKRTPHKIHGLPLLFERTLGTVNYIGDQISASAFVQNYYSPRKYLQLGFGVRWQYQSRINDYNSVVPRLSLVWSPEKSGRFIIRSGGGALIPSLEFFRLLTIENDNAQDHSLVRIFFPEFPVLSEAYEDFEFVKPNISRLGPRRNPNMYVGFIGGTFEPIDSTKLTFGYVGLRANHLIRMRDVNLPYNGKRPDENFEQIKFYEFAGNSNAHLMTVSSETKVGGVSIDANYNLIFASSDFNDSGFPSDSRNLKLDYGPVDNDRRHEFNISSSFTPYILIDYKPFYNIRINLITNIGSGLPYNITTGDDDNGDGVVNDRPRGVTRNSVREEWYFQVDARLNWQFPKRKFGSWALEANIYNIFNKSNRMGYVGVVSSPLFGQATNARVPRRLSLGLSFRF